MGPKRSRESISPSGDSSDGIRKSPGRQSRKKRRQPLHSQNDTIPISSAEEQNSADRCAGSRLHLSSESDALCPDRENQNRENIPRDNITHQATSHSPISFGLGYESLEYGIQPSSESFQSDTAQGEIPSPCSGNGRIYFPFGSERNSVPGTRGSQSDPASESEASSHDVENENPFVRKYPLEYLSQHPTPRIPFHVLLEWSRNEELLDRVYRRRFRHRYGNISSSHRTHIDTFRTEDSSLRSESEDYFDSSASEQNSVIRVGGSPSDPPSESDSYNRDVHHENQCLRRSMSSEIHFPQQAMNHVPVSVDLDYERYDVQRSHLFSQRDGNSTSSRSGDSHPPSCSETNNSSAASISYLNSVNGLTGSRSDLLSETEASPSDREGNRGVDQSSIIPTPCLHFRFHCTVCPYPYEGDTEREGYCSNCICYICDKHPSECLAWPQHCILTNTSERSKRLRQRSLAMQNMNGL